MNGLIRTFERNTDYVLLNHGDLTITFRQDGNLLCSHLVIKHGNETLTVRSGPMSTDRHGVKFRTQFMGPKSFKVIPSQHLEHRGSAQGDGQSHGGDSAKERASTAYPMGEPARSV